MAFIEQHDAIKQAIESFLFPVSVQVQDALLVGDYEQKIKNAITCSVWLACTLFKGIAEVSYMVGDDSRHGYVAIAVGPMMEAGKPVKTSTANALRGVVYLWNLSDIPETNDPNIVLRLVPTKTSIGRSIKSRPVLLSMFRGVLHAVSKSDDTTCVVTRLTAATWHNGYEVIGTFQYDYDFPMGWCEVFDPTVHFTDHLAAETSILVPVSVTENLQITLVKP